MKATAPVVQSETSSLANVIDTQALTSLPVNGRMIDTFILTTAGNTSDSASNPKIGGAAHWGATSFTVNGVATNDLGNGGGSYSFSTAMATQPSLDTIQEFKVESNSAKAEYGGSVAVSILTKSGTNDFHGSAYAYNRNRELAANQILLEFRRQSEAPLQPQRVRRLGRRPHRQRSYLLLRLLRRPPPPQFEPRHLLRAHRRHPQGRLQHLRRREGPPPPAPLSPTTRSPPPASTPARPR